MRKKICNGYILIYKPEHESCIKRGKYTGYIYEHRFVAETFMGRKLRRDEDVHHLDFDKKNNRPSNLLVLHKDQHKKLHNWIKAGCKYKKNPRKEEYKRKRNVKRIRTY